MKRIAIIGATGMLGRPATQAFIDAGFDVALFVRDRRKAEQLFPHDVRIYQGALENSDSLKAVLKDQDSVYLNLSVKPGSRKNEFQPERDIKCI